MDDNMTFETATEARLYKKEQKKKLRKIKPLNIILMIAIVCILKFLAPQPVDEITGEVAPKNAGKRENILIMGTDGGGLRADVLMIASVSRGEVNIISVPRDTRIHTGTQYMKINSALSVGGDDYVIEKVEGVTGIDIHEYIKVDFSAVENVIDAFGGVDFNVPQDMDYEDPEQDLYIHLKEGFRHLNGEDSLKMLRFRNYAMADIQRTAVQRDFIKAFVGQNLNFSLVFKIPRAAFEFIRGADTSLNIFETAINGVKVLLAGKNRINTVEIPYYFSSGGTYVLIDDAKMEETVNRYFK